VDQGIWKEAIRKNAYPENMESHDRIERRVCTEEGKSLSIVKGRKGGSEGVCLRTAEEGIYPTIKVTPDGTSILCRKKRWKEADGTEL